MSEIHSLTDYFRHIYAEKREEIEAQVEALRASRNRNPKKRNKPCVYLCSVTRVIEAKSNKAASFTGLTNQEMNDRIAKDPNLGVDAKTNDIIKVDVVWIDNGNNRIQRFSNFENSTGKFPVDFDFPTQDRESREYDALAEQAEKSASSIITPAVFDRLVKGKNGKSVYSVLERHLRGRISEIVGIAKLREEKNRLQKSVEQKSKSDIKNTPKPDESESEDSVRQKLKKGQ